MSDLNKIGVIIVSAINSYYESLPANEKVTFQLTQEQKIQLAHFARQGVKVRLK